MLGLMYLSISCRSGCSPVGLLYPFEGTIEPFDFTHLS